VGVLLRVVVSRLLILVSVVMLGVIFPIYFEVFMKLGLKGTLEQRKVSMMGTQQ